MLVHIIIGLLFVHQISSNDEPIVEINNGKLLGTYNGIYYSFKGIPYAEPPIGENRFESPKPYIKIWDNIFDATNFGNNCISAPDALSRTTQFSGSEDCLYMNIYSPDIYNDKLYPVIVFIHGGAFLFGSGSYLGERIIMKEKKFILVTFNYRLNIFGFLSTADTTISGNFGLKDQRLLLQWVKNNIVKFNGDSNKIILTGFSAGSASVEYYTLQPESDKIIVGAIAMSGSALDNWAFQNEPKSIAIRLGELLNCSTVNTIELKNCLKTKTVEEIVSNLKYFNNFLGSAAGIFTPSAEDESISDAILTKHPREILKMGEFSKVPILLSYTAQDGALITSVAYKEISKLLKFGPQYCDDGETETWLCNENTNLEELYNYFVDENLTDLTQFLTDSIFKIGIYESINLRSQVEGSRTYLYKYDNPAPLGLGNLIALDKNYNFGTCHGDDVFLILNNAARDMYDFRPDEQRISENFLNMIESFVNTGEPVFANITLPKITSDSKIYLDIKADDYQIMPIVDDVICVDIKTKFCNSKLHELFKFF